MKKLVLGLSLFIAVQLYGQIDVSQPAFSEFKFGFNGGLNFDKSTEMGSNLNVQVQTNIVENLNLFLSLGYASLIDDHGFTDQYYRTINIDDGAPQYQTVLNMVDKVEYHMIPIKLGFIYDISQLSFSNFVPFALFDIGYCFSNAKAQSVKHNGIAGNYDSVGEVPSPYDKLSSDLKDGSTFLYGLGMGVAYSLTESLDLSISYVYQHNDAIVNNNQLILGVNF